MEGKMMDAISRSAALEVGNVRQVTEYDESGYSMTYNAVPVDVIEALPALDVAQIVGNGQDTTYLRVKSLDGLRGRIVIDEESGNRCAMYYEEAEDLAPVIRCKDCISWGFGKCGEPEYAKTCAYAQWIVGANDYCSYAVRKDTKGD